MHISKKLSLIFFVLVSVSVISTFLVASGQVTINLLGSPNTTIKQEFTKNFEKIKIDIEADITIYQSNTDSVTIETTKAKASEIKISQTSKTINIQPEKKSLLNIQLINQDSKPKISIYMKQLQEIEINSKSKVQIQKYSTDRISIIFNSDGSLIADSIQAKKIEIDQKLSGFVSLNGSAEELSLNTADSARSLLRYMQVKTAVVNSTGTGSIELNVTDSLSVKSSGSSPIKYQGVPAIKKDIKPGSILSSF